METLILIPIIAVIIGWWRSTPAVEPPEGANGFDDPTSSCAMFTDSGQLNLFSDDDNSLFNPGRNLGLGMEDDLCTDTGTGWNIFNDDSLGGFSGMSSDSDIIHDLLLNPAFESLSGNIYHHEDMHIDTAPIEILND